MFMKQIAMVALAGVTLVGLSSCAKKDDGLLLFLPPDAQGAIDAQGGPGDSPETAATDNGDTSQTGSGADVATDADTGNGDNTSGGDTGNGDNTSGGDTGNGDNTSGGDTGNGDNTSGGDTGNGDNTSGGDTGNGDNTSGGDTGNGDNTSGGDTGNGDNTSGGDTGNGDNTSGGDTASEDSSTDDSGASDSSSDSSDSASVSDTTDSDDLADDAYGENSDSDDVASDSGSDSDEHASSEKACQAKIKIITKKGRWYKSSDPNDDSVSGVHTYWRNQPLKVRIKLKGKKRECRKYRWAKLVIEAKNIHGPLPGFYKAFNVEVRRGKRHKIVGSAVIPASDDAYKTGGVYVRLRRKNTFWLYWTNDAWKPKTYDANINIRSVKIKLLKRHKPGKRMALNGNSHCFTKGRFFFDQNTARTYWKNQTIGYCFNDLKPGLYKVQVVAKNYGKYGLPPKYEAFKINVAADGVSRNIKIKASDEAYNKGEAVLDLRGGDTVVNLTWLNDAWKPKTYDANIQYRKIALKRVGDSERAGLAAYIGQHSNTIVILMSLFVALAALASIMVYRRRMEEFK